MEADGLTTRAPRSGDVGANAAGAAEFTPQGVSFLVTRRPRRRRRKQRPRFKTYSAGASRQSPSCGGSDRSTSEHSTNTAHCRTPPVDSVLGQDNIKEDISDGEYIMTVINSFLEVVINMSSDLQVAASHLFGSCSFHDNAAGAACSSSHRGDVDTQVEGAEASESVDSYEQRLEAVLMCLWKADSNVGQIKVDATSVETYLDRDLDNINRRISGHTSSKTKPAITKKEAFSSIDETIGTCNKQYRSSMEEEKEPPELYQGVDDGNYKRRQGPEDINEHQLHTGSLADTLSTAKSEEHTMVSNNVATQEHMSKSKDCSRMTIQCMKSMVQILNLALEANRVTQQAVNWVKTRDYEFAEHIVAIVSDAAGVTSQNVSSALSEAENGLLIYEELVTGITEVQRPCCGNQMTVKDNDVVSVGPSATADEVGKLARRTSKISLDETDHDSAEELTNVGTSDGEKDTSSRRKVVRNSDEIPSQVSQTILRASHSSLSAVDAALTVLEILSVSQLYPGDLITKL